MFREEDMSQQCVDFFKNTKIEEIGRRLYPLPVATYNVLAFICIRFAV